MRTRTHTPVHGRGAGWPSDGARVLRGAAPVCISQCANPSHLSLLIFLLQAENLEALVDFYNKYPEYLNRPLYLTGEQ
jgi:hypothetical protein